MNEPFVQISFDPGQCPLCGQPNECQLCNVAAYKGPCWCSKVEIPETLLAQVPSDFRNKTCICRACVMAFHRRRQMTTPAQVALPGDYYFDANNLMVFTAAYHLRRGFCCDNGCRHCPYANAYLSKNLFPQ